MPIKIRGELLLGVPGEAAFRHAGSTFVTAKTHRQQQRIKVLGLPSSNRGKSAMLAANSQINELEFACFALIRG